MEAFVLVMLAICFIATFVISAKAIKELIRTEDHTEKEISGLCAALFIFMLVAITFLACIFIICIGVIL